MELDKGEKTCKFTGKEEKEMKIGEFLRHYQNVFEESSEEETASCKYICNFLIIKNMLIIVTSKYIKP